ncbi:MAG: hypothetical protein ACQEVA_11175 [Myxococcota bacterium]
MKRALMLMTLLAMIWPAAVFAQSNDDSSQSEGQSGSAENSPYVSGELEATPKDKGYGEHTPAEANRFPTTLSDEAPVDAPMERTSMGDKNILVPTAATPEKGTWIISSHNLLVNHLSYAPSDSVELTLGLRIPTARQDFIGSFSSKFALVETRNYSLSVQPFAAYSNGIRTLDTSQFGLGSGLLFDWKVHDNVMIHFGGYGFANLFYTFNERDTSDCGTRSEFGPDCIGVNTRSRAFPAGGHWISGSTGISWFLGDSFSLHGEVILGGVMGTFFGVEDNSEAQNQEIPEPLDLAAFEDPTFKAGFPHGSGPTWSFGVGYGSDGFAMQLDFVFFRNIDDPDTVVVDESQEMRLLPVAAASYAF